MVNNNSDCRTCESSTIMNFETFIKDKNQPVVFKNCINEWPASKWTLHHLAQYLKDKEIRCKIGPKFQGIFETQCLYLEVTIDDFIEWCSSKSSPSNPLHQIDQDKYFCYLDYKYMVDLFSDNPEILQSIDWGVFGLTDRNGSDSTIWIGSDGCTTPCHYDTYGFNLVAQISGRKKWYLFPESDIVSLYSTRIPYEESSVFSEVDITHTDLKKHPLFKDSNPYMVILEPGDVLYVPKHWWHYVECLDTAISVNTWVEMEDDNETRVKEALTRILVSSLTSNNNDSNDSLVNPTETIQSDEVNFEYFQKAIEMITSRKGDKAHANGTALQTLLHENKVDSNPGTSDTNRESIDACNSNKFQQFCDKFQSWKVHDFEDSNRFTSIEKRKLDQTDVLQAEKQKSLKIIKTEQRIVDSICIILMEKGTSCSETDSERKLSKSAKNTPQIIYKVSKCNHTDLQASEDSLPPSDCSTDHTDVSNSARLLPPSDCSTDNTDVSNSARLLPPSDCSTDHTDVSNSARLLPPSDCSTDNTDVSNSARLLPPSDCSTDNTDVSNSARLLPPSDCSTDHTDVSNSARLLPLSECSTDHTDVSNSARLLPPSDCSTDHTDVSNSARLLPPSDCSTDHTDVSNSARLLPPSDCSTDHTDVSNSARLLPPSDCSTDHTDVSNSARLLPPSDCSTDHTDVSNSARLLPPSDCSTDHTDVSNSARLLPPSDCSTDHTDVSNSARLRYKLIKSILKPKVIDKIFEEFNTID